MPQIHHAAARNTKWIGRTLFDLVYNNYFDLRSDRNCGRQRLKSANAGTEEDFESKYA